MRIGKQLAVVLATAATLVGTSAFAESRPSKETRSRGESGNIQRRERSAPRVEGRSESRRGDNSAAARRPEGRVERRSEAGSSGSRVEVEAQRGDRGQGNRTRAGRSADRTPARTGTYQRDRSGNNRRDSNWRSDSRNRGRSYGNRDRSYGNRTPSYHRGRVSRVHRYGGGYRVWIYGAPYPYFIPAAYYHSGRFRVGLNIGLGGYYNPLGYYDYYDTRYDDNRRGYSDGVLRGVVESVDYRRDTFVIRNEATGSFVTVEMRDRRRDDLRAGDYVEISGDWSRSGVFQARDVDFLDDDRER